MMVIGALPRQGWMWMTAKLLAVQRSLRSSSPSRLQNYFSDSYCSRTAHFSNVGVIYRQVDSRTTLAFGSCHIRSVLGNSMLKGHITKRIPKQLFFRRVDTTHGYISGCHRENERIIRSSLLQTINIPIFAIMFVFVNRCG
jgi:hypothetical protein